MKPACEGCDWVTERDTAGELQAAMMAHGEETHSNLFQGKSPEKLVAMKNMMTAHIDRMIAAQN